MDESGEGLRCRSCSARGSCTEPKIWDWACPRSKAKLCPSCGERLTFNDLCFHCRQEVKAASGLFVKRCKECGVSVPDGVDYCSLKCVVAAKERDLRRRDMGRFERVRAYDENESFMDYVARKRKERIDLMKF